MNQADRNRVRQTIEDALRDFTLRPLFNLRERDPQGELLIALRGALSPSEIDARLVDQTGTSLPGKARTSRVHCELKVEQKTVDIAIFAGSGCPALTVHRAGPLDVVATVAGSDLDGVIEIKAAPSSSQHKTFERDLESVAALTGAYANLVGFFVLYDKSLALGGAAGHRGPKFDWTSRLVGDPEGRIEAFWVNPAGAVETKIGRLA